MTTTHKKTLDWAKHLRPQCSDKTSLWLIMVTTFEGWFGAVYVGNSYGIDMMKWKQQNLCLDSCLFLCSQLLPLIAVFKFAYFQLSGNYKVLIVDFGPKITANNHSHLNNFLVYGVHGHFPFNAQKQCMPIQQGINNKIHVDLLIDALAFGNKHHLSEYFCLHCPFFYYECYTDKTVALCLCQSVIIMIMMIKKEF